MPFVLALTSQIVGKNPLVGLPAGTVDKNPPANAGDMGLLGDSTCLGTIKPVCHNY